MTYSLRPDHTEYALDMPVEWWGPGRIDAWVAVWVSPQFRKLAHSDSWLRREVIPLLAARPMGWFTPPSNTRFYFSAWLMNAVMRRQYDNPLIQDLYVLHEALHAATLDRFFACASPKDALRVNEILVSLETECWVYERQPEWIGQTFPELWIAQPHIRAMLSSPPTQLCAANPREEEYIQVCRNTHWPLAPAASFFSADTLWHVRRHSSFQPLTAVDKIVAKYENMSARWIEKIHHKAPVVQEGRALLHNRNWQEGVAQWSAFGARHVCHMLPFDDLQLKGLKS